MRRYSFNDGTLSIDGFTASGFANGDDAISFKWRAESTKLDIGADGKGLVSISADRSGEVVLKFQQSSPSIKYLLGVRELQRSGGAAFVPVHLVFKDSYRGDIVSCFGGVIVNVSEIMRGQNANDISFTIHCERMDAIYADAADLNSITF